MRPSAFLYLLLAVWTSLCQSGTKPQSAGARPVIPIEEYRQRRMALCALLDSSSAAVFRAAEPRVRNGDVNYPYRQESNYLYLTGDKTPSGVLVLVPAGLTIRGLHGRVFHISGSGEMDSLGGEEVFLQSDRLQEVINAVASKAQTLYTSAPDLRFVNDWLNDKPMFVERDVRRQFETAHPGVKTTKATGLMARLREVKSTAEVNMIRRAITVTGNGFRRALKLCRPGSYEYELQAALESGMRSGGAEGVAFPSIVGSGPNSLIPHYDDNDREMKKGDLVVMDMGAEYGGYAADVTRTIPVSGVFTPEQKEIYRVVRTAHDEVIKLVKPGVPTRMLEAKAREVISEAGYAKYILHGISHQVGLDVHDAGASDTLRAGMVITVEPGIYIPAADSLPKAYRGTGIRLEDDVLVTSAGSEILSSSIPIDAAIIEKLMR